MKKTHYALTFLIVAGTSLYAQQSSEQQGSVVALGGGRVAQRASARVLYAN